MAQAPVVKTGSSTHVGMVRSENQDAQGSFPGGNIDLSTPKGMLFVIADGMGGHVGGREASSLAVKTIERWYFGEEGKGIAAHLHSAVQRANDAVFQYAKEAHPLATVGTTCTALVLQDDRGYVAHVGDSRIYRITPSYIWQLTDDHSTVGDLVRRRLLTKEEARTHPSRSVLNRALGVSPRVEIDNAEFTLAPNEYYLLCTDGLTGGVEDSEIQEIVVSSPPQEACDALVHLANERGGKDNVTVQVIQVQGDSSLVNRVRRFFEG